MNECPEIYKDKSDRILLLSVYSPCEIEMYKEYERTWRKMECYGD